jgi:hypothetical protein
MVSFTFASTYDSGAYGAGAYETSTTTAGGGTTSSGGTTAGGGSVLTNTGFDIALIVTLACALIFVALVVRFWRKPKTNQQP